MSMFIEPVEQWSQLLGRYNWYTFQFAYIEFEWDRCMGGVEATIVLMGLGFRWRWNYAETDMTKRIAREIQEVRDNPDEALREIMGDSDDQH